MRLKQWILLGCGVFTWANAGTLIDEMSACDQRFFNALYEKGSAEPGFVRSDKAGGVAWFAVEDRFSEDEASVYRFNTPIKEKGLSLIAYYDRYIDLRGFELGEFYFWGFLAENNFDEVKAALPNLAWRETSPDQSWSGGEWVRRSGNEPWKDNPIDMAGILTPSGVMEKGFFIERLPDHPNQLWITCTIQGSVTPAAIMQDRPDLAPEVGEIENLESELKRMETADKARLD